MEDLSEFFFDDFYLSNSNSFISKISMSPGSPPLSFNLPPMTDALKLTWPPKSVSTIMFSKLMSVLAYWWAIFCFLAIRIILNVCQTHHITMRNSSMPYSMLRALLFFETRVTKKTRLQIVTTSASNIFHQRQLLPYGSLKYRSHPTSLTLQAKSIPIRIFSTHSRKMKSGLFATLKPSKIVTRIRRNAKSSNRM